MHQVAAKSPREIEALADGFASGQLFTGLHIALSEDYPDKSKALKTCFLPLSTYTPTEWAEVQRARWVPFQWVRKASVQMSKLPPLYVFHEFEFMTFEDALVVIRYAGAILKQKQSPAPAAPATV